jgi:hypothetical protein
LLVATEVVFTIKLLDIIKINQMLALLIQV